MRAPLLAAGLLAAGLPAAAPALAQVPDGIAAPLTASPGDPARGRAIVVNRARGLCLLCHSGPFPEERFQGELGPSLAGVGSRWSPAQLRLRLVDGRQVNPETIMPSYLRTDGLTRVAPALRGRPLLEPQEIEDVVAFLASQRE